MLSFDTASAAEAQTPAVAPPAFVLDGYSQSGDGGFGVLYRKDAVQPTHSAAIEITLSDGVTKAWYSPAPPSLSIEALGGESGQDCTSAFMRYAELCETKQRQLILSSGLYQSAPVTFPETAIVTGMNQRASFVEAIGDDWESCWIAQGRRSRFTDFTFRRDPDGPHRNIGHALVIEGHGAVLNRVELAYLSRGLHFRYETFGHSINRVRHVDCNMRFSNGSVNDVHFTECYFEKGFVFDGGAGQNLNNLTFDKTDISPNTDNMLYVFVDPIQVDIRDTYHEIINGTTGTNLHLFEFREQTPISKPRHVDVDGVWFKGPNGGTPHRMKSIYRVNGNVHMSARNGSAELADYVADTDSVGKAVIDRSSFKTAPGMNYGPVGSGVSTIN